MRHFVTENSALSWWLIGFVVSGFAFAVYRGFFRARKIQPHGFRWKTFRNETFFAIVNLAIGATILARIHHDVDRTHQHQHGALRAFRF